MTVLLSWVVVLAVTSTLAATPSLRQSMSRWRSAGARRLSASWAEYRELHERRELLRRPWQEEFLHWSFDGQRWELHGHLPSPDGRLSTTSSGWCPGLRDRTAKGCDLR